MDTILVCAAWPYANGPLHLGHIAGCYLPADIFARFQRMFGNKVLMVSGSDMHGTPITVHAEQENVTPEDIAFRYHDLNSKNLEQMGISFDLYTHTHQEDHIEVVHDIFTTLREKGYIYEKSVHAPYCSHCKRFLPDRYVEGDCPHCSSSNARGDQCDDCGKTLDAEELVNPKCKLCGNGPDIRQTDHFYLKLTAFEDALRDHIEGKTFWRDNTRNFSLNWLKEGLKDRPITRDLEWGIPIPLDGYDDKRIYVWFEAVIGYLSTTKKYFKDKGDPEGWRAFWEDEKARIYYFLAKDNIPFHTIIFPSMLLGYGGLNMPYDVPANEYLTLNKEQFSKSRNHAVWLPKYLDRFDPEPLRYYLSINMPEHKDTDFTWKDFVARNNNELVGALGNLIHRILTFTHKNYDKKVPVSMDLGDDDSAILKRMAETFEKVTESLSQTHFKDAMKHIMTLAHDGNRYFDSKAPWALIKSDRDACGGVMNVCCQLVNGLHMMMSPFLPFAAERLHGMLGYTDSIVGRSWQETLTRIPDGQSLGKPKPLFAKLDLDVVLKREEDMGTKNSQEDEKVEESTIPQVAFDEFIKIQMKVAIITEVDDHPKADKLYVLKVDLGEGADRQLVAGIKLHYTKEELVGRRIIVVANLAPAKLRGQMSEGMLLAAESPDGSKVSLLTPDEALPPGSLIH